MIETYEEALKFIHGRTKFKKIPTLTRMRKLMELLGNPQDELTMIHVAGTNGKGSTVAFLRSLFQATGQTVGTFTSPFLTRFNERISLNGDPIADEQLVTITRQVKVAVDELDQTLPEGGPTEFEIVTAIMFTYFAQVKPDIVLVEVGIGGLFDSTNIITPKVSVITTVAFDHMKLLGNTLTEIASQKAGIIKPEVPVVVGKLSDEPLAVVRQTAHEQQARLIERDRDYQVVEKPATQANSERFTYQGVTLDHIVEFETHLDGEFQIDNAATALSAFLTYQELNGIPINVADLKTGIQQATWPGRFEILNQEPMVVIDGAHNVSAIQALTQLLKDKYAHTQIYIILAILADKQFAEMVDELLTLPNVHLILTTFAGPSNARPSASVTELLAHHKQRQQITAIENWQTALAQTVSEVSADDMILFTGSLYFISDVRHYFVD